MPKKQSNLETICVIINTVAAFWWTSNISLPGHWSFSLHFNKISRHTGAHFKAQQPRITGLRDVDWWPKAASSKFSLRCKTRVPIVFSHCTLLVLLGLRLWVGPRLTELSFYIAPISLEQFGGICCHQRYLSFCCCVKSLNSCCLFANCKGTTSFLCLQSGETGRIHFVRAVHRSETWQH